MEATAQKSSYTLPSSTFSSSSHFPLSLSLLHARACACEQKNSFRYLHSSSIVPMHLPLRLLLPPYFFFTSLPPISLLRCCRLSAVSLFLFLACAEESFFLLSHAYAQKRVSWFSPFSPISCVRSGEAFLHCHTFFFPLLNFLSFTCFSLLLFISLIFFFLSQIRTMEKILSTALPLSFSTTRMRKKLSHKARESLSPHSSLALLSFLSLCAFFSLCVIFSLPLISLASISSKERGN